MKKTNIYIKLQTFSVNGIKVTNLIIKITVSVFLSTRHKHKNQKKGREITRQRFEDQSHWGKRKKRTLVPKPCTAIWSSIWALHRRTWSSCHGSYRERSDLQGKKATKLGPNKAYRSLVRAQLFRFQPKKNTEQFDSEFW